MPVDQTKESEMTEPKAKDYSTYATKAPTATHEFYAAWLQERTGVEVDVKGVQLAVNLYADFQKSPEWIAKRDALKAEADAAKAAQQAARKPGTSKAERTAKRIAQALADLQAAGIDTSDLKVKEGHASAIELPGNPVVEPGAVVETPAEQQAAPEQAEVTESTLDDTRAAAQIPAVRKARSTRKTSAKVNA